MFATVGIRSCFAISVLLCARSAGGVDQYGDPLPEDALARVGMLRFRALNSILCVAFSPDSKTVAAAGTGSIGIWDVATGKQVRQFRGSSVSFRNLTFSKDGKTLFAYPY